MATKMSISELDAQIEKLKERRKFLIVKFAERFAHAATKAGLAEMELSDAELDGIVAEIAARFQRKTKDTNGASPQSYRPEAGRTGTPTADSHDR